MPAPWHRDLLREQPQTPQRAEPKPIVESPVVKRARAGNLPAKDLTHAAP